MAVNTGTAAKEFTIGNTRIRIADDFCRDKTEADIKETLTRIARITQQHFSAATAGKQYATTTSY